MKKRNITICIVIVLLIHFIGWLTFEQRTINALKNRKKKNYDALSRMIQDRLVKEGYMRDM